MGNEKKPKPRRVGQSRATPAPAPVVPAVAPPRTAFEEMLERWRGMPLEAQQEVITTLQTACRLHVQLFALKRQTAKEWPKECATPRFRGSEYEPYSATHTARILTATSIASDLLAAGMGVVAPKVDDKTAEAVRAPKTIDVDFDFLTGKHITHCTVSMSSLHFHTLPGVLKCSLAERGPIAPVFDISSVLTAKIAQHRVLSAGVRRDHLAVEAGGTLFRFPVHATHGLSLSEFLHCTWTP